MRSERIELPTLITSGWRSPLELAARKLQTGFPRELNPEPSAYKAGALPDCAREAVPDSHRQTEESRGFEPHSQSGAHCLANKPDAPHPLTFRFSLSDRPKA